MDMPTKTRIIIVSMIILLGGALFSYCLFFRPTEITAQARGDSTTVTGLEAAPVMGTSIDGVEQEKSGQNNQSRSGGRSRPRSGAT